MKMRRSSQNINLIKNCLNIDTFRAQGVNSAKEEKNTYHPHLFNNLS